MQGLRCLLSTARRDESAVTAIEYALLAALIAIAIIAALTATSTSVAAIFTAWSSAVIAAL